MSQKPTAARSAIPKPPPVKNDLGGSKQSTAAAGKQKTATIKSTSSSTPSSSELSSTVDSKKPQNQKSSGSKIRQAQQAQFEEQYEVLTSHPFLPATIMTQAKDLFDHYVSVQRQTLQSRDGSTAGQSRGGGPPRTALEDDDDDGLIAEPELNALAVQKLLLDLGISMTENEIKDTIFVLKQSSDVIQYNELMANDASPEAVAELRRKQKQKEEEDAAAAAAAEQEEEERRTASQKNRKQSHARSSGKPTPRGKPTGGASQQQQQPQPPKPVALTATQPNQELTLPFRLFIDLLCMNLRDVNKETEMQKLWKQLDADQDDMLNQRDIVTAFQRMASENEQLTKDQVAALIEELDCDNDGVVSFRDFLTSMNTN